MVGGILLCNATSFVQMSPQTSGQSPNSFATFCFGEAMCLASAVMARVSVQGPFAGCTA